MSITNFDNLRCSQGAFPNCFEFEVVYVIDFKLSGSRYKMSSTHTRKKKSSNTRRKSNLNGFKNLRLSQKKLEVTDER